MYLGVDIGGTKTLVAVLDEHGVITEQTKFPTPKNYTHFLLELRHTLAHLKTHDFRAGGVGMPATVIDRLQGRGISFGNLPWHNVSLQTDVERIAHCPVVVENDAKLAGLSEAILLKNTYSRVLYVTISTGIGLALIVDDTIDINVGDGGGRTILLEHRGKLTPWEDFASGRAIVERYGKKAEDINDEKTWLTITEPEVIIVGGQAAAATWPGEGIHSMQPLIAKLQAEFPALHFNPGDQFYWSPETGEIFYRAKTHGRQANWSLLHETGHALLKHTSYEADFQLLRFEVAAWERARQLAQQFNLTIDEDHIQDCLDTYRDWLYKRSICPTCNTKCLQQGDFVHYRCFNCHTTWRVTPSRFARAYRTTKNVPQSAGLHII